mmetsp:Transcript_34258/g.108023  ORF Transcript_34258/g.108023 Transcript_34258/m.108023 type:complete len:207 (+) Transcript_34258:983-1603(+)
MVLEVLQELDLAEDALRVHEVTEDFPHLLDCNLSSRYAILRLHDATVGAGSDDLEAVIPLVDGEGLRSHVNRDVARHRGARRFSGFSGEAAAPVRGAPSVYAASSPGRGSGACASLEVFHAGVALPTFCFAEILREERIANGSVLRAGVAAPASAMRRRRRFRVDTDPNAAHGVARHPAAQRALPDEGAVPALRLQCSRRRRFASW